MYLNYFTSIQQILRGLVVSVHGIQDHLDRWFESYYVSYNFFLKFQIEETCTFMNIFSLKYHLSVI